MQYLTCICFFPHGVVCWFILSFEKHTSQSMRTNMYRWYGSEKDRQPHVGGRGEGREISQAYWPGMLQGILKFFLSTPGSSWWEPVGYSFFFLSTRLWCFVWVLGYSNFLWMFKFFLDTSLCPSSLFWSTPLCPSNFFWVRPSGPFHNQAHPLEWCGIADACLSSYA